MSAADKNEQRDPGRALMVLAPAAGDLDHRNLRPAAAFLAHLIAVRQRAPQTRSRNRAEPGQAVARYGATGVAPAPTGRTVSRWY